MNRHLRPFGLKLGPLQAGGVYFPLHFVAVGVGLTLMNAPDGVGVFWPATGTLFAFLLLYPARFWPALLAFGFLAEILANEAFAPSEGAVEAARGILQAWEDGEGSGVVTYDGRMIENLHVESAQRTLAIHEAINSLRADH